MLGRTRSRDRLGLGLMVRILHVAWMQMAWVGTTAMV